MLPVELHEPLSVDAPTVILVAARTHALASIGKVIWQPSSEYHFCSGRRRRECLLSRGVCPSPRHTYTVQLDLPSNPPRLWKGANYPQDAGATEGERRTTRSSTPAPDDLACLFFLHKKSDKVAMSTALHTSVSPDIWSISTCTSII